MPMPKYYFSIIYFIFDLNNLPNEDFIAKYNNFAIIEDFEYMNSAKIMDIIGEEFYKNHIKNELIYAVIDKDIYDIKTTIRIDTPITDEQMFYLKLKYGDTLNSIIKEEFG